MASLSSHLPSLSPLAPPAGSGTFRSSPPAPSAGSGTFRSSPSAPRLCVRELGRADENLIDAVYDGLSPRSRYQRVHGAKPVLGRRERAYLARTDGRDHVALVALDPAGAPLGIVRYVRLRDRPAVADVAAEVVDDWQRRGLAGELLERLALRAAATGVARFEATVLAETGLHRPLLRRGWRVASSDGPTTTLGVDVWALLAGRGPVRRA